MTEASPKRPASETPAPRAPAATIGYAQPATAPRPAPPVMRPVAATVGYAEPSSAPPRAATPRPTPAFASPFVTPAAPRAAPPPPPCAPSAAAPVAATVGFADAPPVAAAPPVALPAAPAVAATVAFADAAIGADTIATPHDDALASTLMGESQPGPATTGAASGPARTATVTTTTTQARSTVFPRVRTGDGGTVVEPAGSLLRYERMRALGEGGVGEVALARDHDIDRVVAVKRLRSDQINAASIVRFAEEVRTVGRLEHPNIVPIHDVGIDEDGQHYFVMKFVEGETLESIIEHLAAGDEAYRTRFSYEHRAQIFLGILQAVGYAHAQGIIHRDIKPANVMVGAFGEVMVMDWGIAKKVREPASAANPDGTEPAPDPALRGRENLFKTRNGALLGTPAYMSPEQARGANDQLDERSDVYSLTVLFHELMTGRHYLHDKQTIGEMLLAVIDVNRSILEYIGDAARSGCPMEWLHFIHKGMSQNPADRYASIPEMIQGVQAILDGECKVQCHVTLIKRTNHEVMHSVDAHPFAMAFAVFAAMALSLVGGVVLVRALLHAFSG